MQGRDSKGAPQRRLRWLLVLAAAGLVAALVLSACGSSNKSSTTAATTGGASTAAPAAAKPTGTPIVTYTFADVNTGTAVQEHRGDSARLLQLDQRARRHRRAPARGEVLRHEGHPDRRHSVRA